MNRRRFLLGSVTVLAGAYVVTRSLGALRLQQFAEQDLPAQLNAWRDRAIQSSGQWQPAQIFSHLAQSIEFSMDGYPQAKPEWFQQTAGTLAYSVFAAAGAMKHNLSEAIPGAPSLDGAHDVEAAIDRLLLAWQRFESHQGQLAPHFAYGMLDKRQYRAAHLMHIENHLVELSA